MTRKQIGKIVLEAVHETADWVASGYSSAPGKGRRKNTLGRDICISRAVDNAFDEFGNISVWPVIRYCEKEGVEFPVSNEKQNVSTVAYDMLTHVVSRKLAVLHIV